MPTNVPEGAANASLQASQPPQRALIIGGGPAGLTAAFELLTRTGIAVTVFEQSDLLGGISRTVNYKGNRIDIGGHRFFSKSDRVMQWWLQMLPMDPSAPAEATIAYHGMRHQVDGTTGSQPRNADSVMLLRPRKSRIYYLGRFFEYPLRLTVDTLGKLGLGRTIKIGCSYIKSALLPIRDERTLEEFFINRFGKELYRTFFKSYTEKVWGKPCDEISAAWGAQRIKGLSIWEALRHAAGKLWRPKESALAQKSTETSLIERFLYPKYGPGQMWEEVARRVTERGGQVLMQRKVTEIFTEGDRVVGVTVLNLQSGEEEHFPGDYVFSTAPIQELMRAFTVAPPANVREVAEGLVYRDFITVGLLAKSLRIHDETPTGQKLIADNWIYIQEPGVQLGRLQVFNNWSPYLVKDASQVWLGLEYFCNETDAIWKLSDAEMIALATEELSRIGIVAAEAVVDATVIRMEKTYPAYFGTYNRLDEVQAFVEGFENLFLIGRNGMHRYNNQDHSILTAMLAVDNIVAGVKSKENLWAVNTEGEYHEEKAASR